MGYRIYTKCVNNKSIYQQTINQQWDKNLTVDVRFLDHEQASEVASI